MSGVATAIVVGGVGGALIGSHSADKASDKQAAAISEASAISAEAAGVARGDVQSLYDVARDDYTTNINQSLNQLQGPNTAIEQFQPYADVGQTALQQQAAYTQSDPFAKFEESDAQKFYRERQEQALLRNQAAIGGLGGGNVRTALQKQAVGIAGQQRDQFGREQQQKFANYGSLANTGLNASSNIANLSQQDRINLANLYERKAGALSGLSTGEGTTLANIAVGQGTQQSNLAQSLGESQAAGIIGQGNALSSGLQSIAMGAGYYAGRPQTPVNPVAANNPYSLYGGYGGQPTIMS